MRALTRRNIPEAVSGGTAWAAGIALLHVLGGPILATSAAIRRPLLLAFFATVRLSADLLQGCAMLLRFALLAVLFILAPNLLGMGIALGLDSFLGLLAGSDTLVGGHGTGATFGEFFAREYGVPVAFELALPASTLGTVVGGLLAGPVARGLGEGALASKPPAPAPVAPTRWHWPPASPWRCFASRPPWR